MGNSIIMLVILLIGLVFASGCTNIEQNLLNTTKILSVNDINNNPDLYTNQKVMVKGRLDILEMLPGMPCEDSNCPEIEAFGYLRLFKLPEEPYISGANYIELRTKSQEGIYEKIRCDYVSHTYTCAPYELFTTVIIEGTLKKLEENNAEIYFLVPETVTPVDS